MPTHTPWSPAPPNETGIPSASIILVRDGLDGLEVLLQRRSAQAQVLGGLYVFPGGKLDAADLDEAWADQLGLSDVALRQRLNEPHTDERMACGLHVTALRETFEEAGVLLVEPMAQGGVEAHRVREHLKAGQPWPVVLQQLGLRWSATAVRPWARWVTPSPSVIPMPRFDARFFVARLPQGQQVEQDGHEAVSSVWLTPRAALQCVARGEMGLMPPQIMSLRELMAYPTAQALWQASERRQPPRIQPEYLTLDGQVLACFPGDPLHSIPHGGLPVRTRLRCENKRFEPLEGWSSWWT